LFDTRIRTPVHVEEALQNATRAVKKMRKMGETQRAQVFRLQKDATSPKLISEFSVRSKCVLRSVSRKRC